MLPKIGRREIRARRPKRRRRRRHEVASVEKPIAVAVRSEREDGEADGVGQSEVGERQQSRNHRLGEVIELRL